MRPLPAVLLDLNDELAIGKVSLRRGRVKAGDLVKDCAPLGRCERRGRQSDA
jgi:hypothetical protein